MNFNGNFWGHLQISVQWNGGKHKVLRCF